jgi:hypothetical protein
MPLTPPKRTAAGYYLELKPPVKAPDVEFARGTWRDPTPQFVEWATQTRKALLEELVSHPTWFSKPPRIDILEPLFSMWVVKSMASGSPSFFCKTPAVPGPESSSGTAIWELDGVLMASTSITPVWRVASFKEDESAGDTISLFGDGDTVDGDTDLAIGSPEPETREIRIEEIADAPPASGPTHIRSREWEARKFLSKERVREARLKAQIAERLARKEESRYYEHFGDLEDGESHFSDYDLTDDESEASTEHSDER